MKLRITTIILLLQTALYADIVELKNGKLFENVRANLLKTELQFQHEGKLLVFKKAEVRRIKLKPVLLKPPVTEQDKLDYEAERVRVAEALQSTSDWEMTANSKPVVAILPLSPGSGVSVSEVESVTNLIRTSIVKTKLFTLVDISIIARDCPKDASDCSKKVGANVKVNKVLSGTITKLGKKYLINGSIMDSKTNTIDFAEKASADSTEKLEEASDYFAKKVSGGIMEFWSEALQAKETESYANIKYVWRSTLIPGFGQWQYSRDKEDKYSRNKSYFIGGISLLLAANLFDQIQKQKKIEQAYSDSHRNYFLTPFGSGLELITFSIDRSNLSAYQKSHQTTLASAGLLIGFYLYNVIDAFFLGKPIFNFKEESSVRGFFFFPSIASVNGAKENNYTIGMQFQF